MGHFRALEAMKIDEKGNSWELDKRDG